MLAHEFVALRVVVVHFALELTFELFEQFMDLMPKRRMSLGRGS
jgi:hypothetical protein